MANAALLYSTAQQPGQPMTARRDVPLNSIRYHAVNAAHKTALMADKRMIDPANLIVMIGEYHNQASHQMFQYYFMRAFKVCFDDYAMCVERSAHDKDFPAHPEQVTEENWLAKATSYKRHSRFTPAQMICGYVASMDQIPYYPIDCHTDYGRKGILQEMPEDMLQRYAGNAIVMRELRAHPRILDPKAVHSNIGAVGMAKRDLFMMDRTLRAQEDTRAPLLLINGNDHISDSTFTRRSSLARLLLANGKDLMTIMLETEGYDRKSMERAHENMVSQLPRHELRTYHHRNVFTLPETIHTTDAGGNIYSSRTGNHHIRRIMGAQMEIA